MGRGGAVALLAGSHCKFNDVPLSERQNVPLSTKLQEVYTRKVEQILF